MRQLHCSLLVAPVVVLFLLAPTLGGIDRLGFRDVSHFYTPLYDYVAWRMHSDGLPLWNPHDQTGMPLMGETTTAVLYPVRALIFALPISSESAIAWYVAIHLLLASVAAFLAARLCDCRPLAASLAGVVYPLSGSIVFLYANPPFLVGAAWLPIVMGLMLTRQPIGVPVRTIGSAAAMSMMILGGDPHTALHAMLVVTAVWLGRMIRHQKICRSDTAVVFVAPLLAAVLAAPQLAASISWSSQSDRIVRRDVEHWIDPPIIGGKRYESFQYSVAPWHVAELATPNAFGSLLPIHQRTSRLIPGDSRVWTPSIYMGTLAALVLLGRMMQIRTQGVDLWLGTAVFSLLLALGGYGIVWWIQSATGRLDNVDSAIGGPYWLLYQLVPGYDSFRYPAKWLTMFSLALAMVTARSVDRDDFGQGIRYAGALLAALSMVALVAVSMLRWTEWLAGAAPPNDEFWGPLVIDGGLKQIQWSLLQTLIVLCVIMVLIRLQRRGTWSRQTIAAWLLVVVAMDLGIFASSMIYRVPRATEQQLLAELPQRREPHDVRWMRTQVASGLPVAWKETSDARRLVDVEASLRASWFGRWHLADRAGVLNNMVSIQSREMSDFWMAARRATHRMSSDQREQFWHAMRRWLSVGGVVHTTETSVAVPSGDRTALLIETVRRIDDRHDALVAMNDWRHVSKEDRNVAAFVDQLREIARSDGNSLPIVESTPDPQIEPDRHGEATVKVIADLPEWLEAQITAPTPQLLVRPCFQDGHWTARYRRSGGDWIEAPVDRVDRLKQGVRIPSGNWEVWFEYKPWWLPWSIALATCSWLLVIAAGVRRVFFV